MNYMSELRELVGSRPLIMVGAAALVLDSDRRLLMMQRSDNGCWGIPGGAMEPGESLEDTARRETLEETGLMLGEMALFGVFSGPELFYEYPNGAQVHNVSVVYHARYSGGEIRLDEYTAYDFFPLANLPEALSPPIRPVLREAVRRL
jgi:ADP-ribose pyrophosphatase YjhB (NUDIX family)